MIIWKKLKEDSIRVGSSITTLTNNIRCSKEYIISIINYDRNSTETIAVKLFEWINEKFNKYFL